MLANLQKILCGAAMLLGMTLAVPAMAGPSDSMTDKDVYASMIDTSANTCMDYSGAKAEPDIRKIPIGTIRMAYDRKVLLCPNMKLTSGPAVVWYGNHKAMVWNPDTAGAADIMAAQLTDMAHDDAYPSEIKTWGADGKPIDHHTVPMFEVNCASSSTADCNNR